jgi:murein DD-endopeptidase MepM/ murein hydrolase activator NlpD
MIDSSDDNDGNVCGMCAGPLRGRRYARTEAGAVYIFCSEACVSAAAREERRERWSAHRRTIKYLLSVAIVCGAWLAPHQIPLHLDLSRAKRTPERRVPSADTTMAPLPAGWFGPDWPPTEISVLAALGRDAWVHPLSGPIRRMPRTDSRVFGAVRPGDRPIECRNGHCGVDLGGEIWGEHIHAAHDGVVDFVQRGLNPDRGGTFVRLSHHNGTIFTQYFHLSAIPRWVERGAIVKGGDVIGALGDTGVKTSAPHLHFAMSMRPSKEWPEKYIDPEPLVSLWPLRVPVDGSEIALVTIVGEPAVPLGSALPKAGRTRAGKTDKSRRGSDDSRKSKEAPSDAESETETLPSESSSDSSPTSQPTDD